MRRLMDSLEVALAIVVFLLFQHLRMDVHRIQGDKDFPVCDTGFNDDACPTLMQSRQDSSATDGHRVTVGPHRPSQSSSAFGALPSPREDAKRSHGNCVST